MPSLKQFGLFGLFCVCVAYALAWVAFLVMFGVIDGMIRNSIVGKFDATLLCISGMLLFAAWNGGVWVGKRIEDETWRFFALSSSSVLLALIALFSKQPAEACAYAGIAGLFVSHLVWGFRPSTNCLLFAASHVGGGEISWESAVVYRTPAPLEEVIRKAA